MGARRCGRDASATGADRAYVHPPTGAHVWSSRYGSSLMDEAIGIGATASGNVLATGSLQGSVDFDGVSLVSAGGQDLVILRHTP